MSLSAPRIDPELVAAVARVDRPDRPIAETNRAVGEIAAQLGLPKPSYEQVRAIAHQLRKGRRAYGLRDAAVDLSFRVRSPEAVLDHLMSGEPPREHK